MGNKLIKRLVILYFMFSLSGCVSMVINPEEMLPQKPGPVSDKKLKVNLFVAEEANPVFNANAQAFGTALKKSLRNLEFVPEQEAEYSLVVGDASCYQS